MTGSFSKMENTLDLIRSKRLQLDTSRLEKSESTFTQVNGKEPERKEIPWALPFKMKICRGEETCWIPKRRVGWEERAADRENRNIGFVMGRF